MKALSTKEAQKKPAKDPTLKKGDEIFVQWNAEEGEWWGAVVNHDMEWSTGKWYNVTWADGTRCEIDLDICGGQRRSRSQ